MSNATRSTVILASALVWSAGAAAQMSSLLQVHPDSITAGSQFLVEVDSYWPDGCRGDIRVEADGSQIDVVLDRSSLRPDIECTQALVPVQALVNPRDHVDGELQMNPSFKVRLVRRGIDGAESVERSREVQLADAAPSPARAQPGSWTSSSAPKTAITMEQQGALLGAIVAGTDAHPGRWQLVAGRLNGSVFSGALKQTDRVRCDDCDSEELVTREVGRANILIEGFNRMLVDLRHQDNAAPGVVKPPRYYSRFNLDVNDPATTKPIAPAVTFPDIEGVWFAGTGDSLQRIEIREADIAGNQADYEVSASADPATTALPPSPRVHCALGTAGVSTAVCEFQDRDDSSACGPRFRIIDVGETRVTGFDPCGDGEAAPFFMFRQ